MKRLLWLLLVGAALTQGAFASKDYYAEGVPAGGVAQEIGSRYVNLANGDFYVCTSTTYANKAVTCNWTKINGGGAGVWGAITGTLSGQTDLQTALNLLAPTASPVLTGTPDASGATQFKHPVAAGYTALGDGELGWDSTTHWPHAWGMAGNVGGPLDKALFLQSTTEIDANTYAQGSSTCGIQEAIAACPNAAAVGCTVHIHGRCTTSTPITIRASSGLPDTVSIVGDGPNSTQVNFGGTGTTGVIAVGGTTFDTRNVSISDINISCGGGLGCIGIYATRTKNLRLHHLLFDNSSAVASGNTAAGVVLDGSSTGGTFSAFTHMDDSRILNGFHSGVIQKGSGSNEASNNNNLYENNELTQVNSGDGIGYDFQTGGGNTIVGGDIQNYSNAVHVRGRGNQINGFMEGNTTDVNFDYGTFSAAEDNIVYGFCTPTCTITDNGQNNILIDPVRGPVQQTSPSLYTVVEEFDGGSPGTSYVQGRLGWVGTSASANITSITPVADHPGIFELTTTASINTVSAIEAGNLTTVLPQGKSWNVTWVVRDNSAAATQTNLRVGLADAYNGDPPGNGFWFENVSGASATNWSCVTSKATTQTSTAFSISHVLDLNWHKIEMSDDGSDNITFRYDGVVECTIANTNIPVLSLVPFAQIKNTTGTAKLLDLDFFSMWMKTSR